MPRFAILPALAALLLFAGSPAASGFDAKTQAKTIAPYLDSGAVAVGRLDLTKVDVDAAFKVLQQFVPVPPGELQPAREAIQGRIVKPLLEEKVREIFLVLSLDEIPNGKPIVIAPVGEGGSHRKVAGILFGGSPDGPTSAKAGNRRSPFEICTQVGNVVFCGSRAGLKRIEERKPSPRSNLEAAFQSVDGAGAQLLFVPSDVHRRILSELFPKLPTEYGGMSGEEISQAVQWASLRVDLPKLEGERLVGPKAEMFVQAENNAVAEKLKETLIALGKLAAKQPIPEDFIRPEDVAKIPTQLKPTVADSRLTLTFDSESEAGKTIVKMFSSTVGSARKAAQRTTSQNNLKQLGLAMHNFHDTYRGFPPVASFKKDDNGKEQKLLSWRVYVLPYLEQQQLFMQFRLDEPWDSDHNKKLIDKMPRLFADPRGLVKEKGKTRYVAPVHPKGIFTGEATGVQIRDITDGTSNTIMLVEAAPESAVVWTKPDDLNIDEKDLFKGLVAKDVKYFLGLLGDGSVRRVPRSIANKTLKAIFTRNGGEVVEAF